MLELLHLRLHRGDLLLEFLSSDFTDLRLFSGPLASSIRQVAVDVRLRLLQPALHALFRKVLVAAVNRLELATINRHQRRRIIAQAPGTPRQTPYTRGEWPSGCLS